MPQFSFLLVFSHHYPSMNYHYIFLLLLVVLSIYSESPQYAKPPPIGVTVYLNSISAKLGVLAPVLPQNEVYRLPHNEVYKIALLQKEMNGSVLPQNGVLKIVNCQLSNQVKTIVDYMLNVAVKNSKILLSTLIHAGEKLGWGIRIFLESLQHISKMYSWSLSENQASIQFKCRLIGLLLKQSLFRKHDFVVGIYKLHHDYQDLCFWHLKFFSNYRNNSHTYIREEHFEKSTIFHFYGGGKALIFSFDELQPYASSDLHEQQYQFLQCVKKDSKQNLNLNDGGVLCSVPLNVLASKLTLKAARDLANLHHVYMPSKIQLKNAQVLLENHKCKTCPDLLAVFQPYRVSFNAKYQQTWYQKNKEKRAEYDKLCASNFEYQESHKKSSQKHYWSTKDVKDRKSVV